MNVELLHEFGQIEDRYFYQTPSPELCAVKLNDELTVQIGKLKNLIVDQELNEVSIKYDDANWFASIESIIFQKINTFLHVTTDSVFFTGAFSPKKIAVFKTQNVPLNDINEFPHQQARSPNLSLLDSSIAKAKIKEIENLNLELHTMINRLQKLESIVNAIDEYRSASISVDGEIVDEAISKIVVETRSLADQTDKIQKRIDRACLVLCETILGIKSGDRLLTQFTNSRRSIELMINHVIYYDGAMYISGLKILKNGNIGKRGETTSIRISPEREPSQSF